MRISELSRMISPSTANHRPLQSTASPVATTTTPAAAPALGTIPTSSRPSSRLQSPGTSSPFFHAVPPAVRRHPARQLLRRSRPVLYCGIALLSRQGSCASDTAFPFLFLRELQAVFLNAVYCLSAHHWSPLHLDCMDLRPHFCALQFTLSCIGRLGGFNLHRYNFNFYGVLASPRQLRGGLAPLPLPAATIFWPTLPGPLCGGSTCDGTSSSASFTGWLLAPLGFCSYVPSSPTGAL